MAIKTKDFDIKKLTIIVDSREKENRHIIKYLDQHKISYETKGLKAGDYSFIYDDIDYSSQFICERKRSLNEISSNLTKYRERFKNEFKRAENAKYMVLFIEDCSLDDVINNNYDTMFNSKAFLASLFSFQMRNDVKLHFISSDNSALLILSNIKQFLRILA